MPLTTSVYTKPPSVTYNSNFLTSVMHSAYSCGTQPCTSALGYPVKFTAGRTFIFLWTNLTVCRNLSWSWKQVLFIKTMVYTYLCTCVLCVCVCVHERVDWAIEWMSVLLLQLCKLVCLHMWECCTTWCNAVNLSSRVDFVQHGAMIYVIPLFVLEETDEGEEEEEVEEGYAELVDTSKLIY